MVVGRDIEAPPEKSAGMEDGVWAALRGDWKLTLDADGHTLSDGTVGNRSSRSMNLAVHDAKEQLRELAVIIDAHSDWWRFPVREPVQGFLGTGPVFIVGDQPSKSQWGPDHPNRRAFYGLLQKIGGSHFHLTDLYKRRGKSEELRKCLPPNLKALPPDFTEHMTFFKREVALLQPTRIVALGNLAQILLSIHLPELKPVRRMWHFSYAVQHEKLDQYEENMRCAIWGAE